MTHIQKTHLKMFWFARWLAMNYIECLNRERGYWYAEQLKYFENMVYPNMLREAKRTNDLKETLKILNICQVQVQVHQAVQD